MSNKEYWITDSRFKWISILLFVMFLIFMALIFARTEQLILNPCQLCSEKMGEDVICTIKGSSQSLIYHPDYSVEDDTGFRIQLGDK